MALIKTNHFATFNCPFIKREKESFVKINIDTKFDHLGGETFLQKIHIVPINNKIRLNFLESKDMSWVAYVTFSETLEQILKVIERISIENNCIHNSSEKVLKFIYDSPVHLTEIYGQYNNVKDQTFEEFCITIVSESNLYIDDMQNQYCIQLFEKLEPNRGDNSKFEFVGGILHSLARHYIHFNKLAPASDGDLEFQFYPFITSLVEIIVLGQTIESNIINDLTKIMSINRIHKRKTAVKKFKVVVKNINGIYYLRHFCHI